MSGSASNTHKDPLKESDLLVCDGCICCASTYYNKVPDCIGCSGKSEFLCLVGEQCCKLGAAPLWCTSDDKYICQIGCILCSCALKSPTTLCKCQNHLCCYVANCALPTDSEIPCVIAACCLMCYPECGCCKPLKKADQSTQK